VASNEHLLKAIQAARRLQRDSVGPEIEPLREPEIEEPDPFKDVAAGLALAGFLYALACVVLLGGFSVACWLLIFWLLGG
jgi:hypothetical protein